MRFKDVRLNIFLFLIFCKIILVLSDSEDEKFLNQIDIALKLAEEEEAKEENTNFKKGAITPRFRTSAKFTPETEEIGRSSNINLRAYQNLINLGIPRNVSLRALSRRRPLSCTHRLLNCRSRSKFRTIDGTCNNFQNKYWGSSFTPFNRLLPAFYEDGFNEPRGGKISKLPNVRAISSLIHPDLITDAATLTNMVGQFGQFVDHDLSLTPEGDKKCCTTDTHVDCLPIQIFSNDSFYSTRTVPQTCMDFTRSTPYCFPTQSGIREQMNILTAYADASNVYGSENKRINQLREFKRGRLRVNRNNEKLLPTVKEVEEAIGEKIEFMGEFLAGDERVNEMPNLAVLHTLFVREHNRIAEQIEAARPYWDDDRIFEESRRLVIAEWQNILYGEYLPIILGPDSIRQYRLDTEFSSYDPSVDATIFHSFATAAYRFGHTLINGIVRLLRQMSKIDSYRLRDNFFNSEQILADGGQGYNYLLSGLVEQPAQAYDPFVTEDLTNFLIKEPKNDFGGDLIARNLQRGREHGLRSYNDYRKFCGFPRLPNSFNSNEPSFPKLFPGTWDKLSRIYNNPMEIDLFTGGLIEIGVPGGLTGPTFNCIKSRQFYRTKYGDRFFFTHRNEAGSFSPVQLAHIKKRKFSDIICDNSDLVTIPIDVFHLVNNKNNTTSPSSGNRKMSCNPNASDNDRVILNVNLFI